MTAENIDAAFARQLSGLAIAAPIEASLSINGAHTAKRFFTLLVAKEADLGFYPRLCAPSQGRAFIEEKAPGPRKRLTGLQRCSWHYRLPSLTFPIDVGFVASVGRILQAKGYPIRLRHLKLDELNAGGTFVGQRNGDGPLPAFVTCYYKIKNRAIIRRLLQELLIGDIERCERNKNWHPNRPILHKPFDHSGSPHLRNLPRNYASVERVAAKPKHSPNLLSRTKTSSEAVMCVAMQRALESAGPAVTITGKDGSAAS